MTDPLHENLLGKSYLWFVFFQNYMSHYHRHLQMAAITIKQKFQLAKKKNSFVFHFYYNLSVGMCGQ